MGLSLDSPQPEGEHQVGFATSGGQAMRVRDAFYAICLVSMWALQPAEAYGQGFTTGNQLLSDCASKEGEAAYYQLQANCVGYIAGVADALAFLSVSMPEAKLACIPSIPLGQARDIVVRYLEEHPDKRHLSAGAIAWTALRLAFPCPQ